MSRLLDPSPLERLQQKPNTQGPRAKKHSENVPKILILNGYGGGGGSRTPVRRGLQLGDYMLIPFAIDFIGGPQERATTNHRLACFRLRGLARDFQAANPRPARLMTPLSALRAEQRRRLPID